MFVSAVVCFPILQGASVLRMLEDFMGESFQIGINAFLKKFKYSNAVTQDLWNELTTAWASHVPDGAKVRMGKEFGEVWLCCIIYPS